MFLKTAQVIRSQEYFPGTTSPTNRLQSQMREGLSLVFTTEGSTTLTTEDLAGKQDLNQWKQKVAGQPHGGGSCVRQCGGW